METRNKEYQDGEFCLQEDINLRDEEIYVEEQNMTETEILVKTKDLQQERYRKEKEEKELALSVKSKGRAKRRKDSFTANSGKKYAQQRTEDSGAMQEERRVKSRRQKGLSPLPNQSKSKSKSKNKKDKVNQNEVKKLTSLFKVTNIDMKMQTTKFIESPIKGTRTRSKANKEEDEIYLPSNSGAMEEEEIPDQQITRRNRRGKKKGGSRKPATRKEVKKTAKATQNARKEYNQKEFDKQKRIRARKIQNKTAQNYQERVNKALFVLQENSIPDKILCREDEKAKMVNFFTEGIESEGNSQSLCKHLITP